MPLERLLKRRHSFHPFHCPYICTWRCHKSSSIFICCKSLEETRKSLQSGHKNSTFFSLLSVAQILSLSWQHASAEKAPLLPPPPHLLASHIPPFTQPPLNHPQDQSSQQALRRISPLIYLRVLCVFILQSIIPLALIHIVGCKLILVVAHWKKLTSCNWCLSCVK